MNKEYAQYYSRKLNIIAKAVFACYQYLLP